MEELARLGLFITCLLAVYVGVRTLWIWRRTRMVAELAIGSNVLGIAIGGAILVALGAIYEPGGEPSPIVPYTLGLFGIVVHVSAHYIGTWKIFRAGDRWPLPLAVVATGLAMVWMMSAIADRDPAVWRAALMLCVRGLGMFWAAYECFRWSAALRKRVALGLAEAMIAHRIWLWGLGASAQVVVIALDLGCQLNAGEALAATPLGLHATSLLGLVGISAIALAFFPPRAYIRLVGKQAETTA